MKIHIHTKCSHGLVGKTTFLNELTQSKTFTKDIKQLSCMIKNMGDTCTYLDYYMRIP